MKVNNEIIETIHNHFRKALNIGEVENGNKYLSKEDIKRLKGERSRLKAILRVVGPDESELYLNLLNEVEIELKL